MASPRVIKRDPSPRVIKSDLYTQCPVCGFSEKHMVSCVVSKLEARLEKSRIATDNFVMLEIGLNIAMSWYEYKGVASHAQFAEIIRQRDLAFNTLRNVWPFKDCVCDGPVAQPCSPECLYPYIDQRSGPFYARPKEIPYHG